MAIEAEGRHTGGRTGQFLRVGYVAVLASATLLPFGLDPSLAEVQRRLIRALTPHLVTRDLVDAARNLALFAGWGLLWVLTSRSSRVARQVMAATLTGLALSLALESLQLLSGLRRASILDVLTNGSGAAGGAFCTAASIRALRDRIGRPSFVGIPALVFLVGYGGATVLEAVFPTLRQDSLPVWGGPLNRLTAAVNAFDPASIARLPWLEGLLFVPAGAVAVAALVEGNVSRHRAAAAAAAGGFVVMLAAEIGHGAVSHPIELGPALVHGAGFAVGAAAAGRWLPAIPSRLRGRTGTLLLVGVYAALALLWTSRPFDVALDPLLLGRELGLQRFVPMSSYGLRGDLYGVATVGKLFLLYLPLGALLAVRPLRRGGPLGGVLPALYVAGAGELSHIVIATRFFDVTDLLVACAGAAVGWAMIRRAGFGAPAGRPRQPLRTGGSEGEGAPCGA